MKLPLWTRTFDPWVWAAGALALLACVALIAWFATAPGRARDRAADARVTLEQARTAGAGDAVNLQDAARTAAALSEQFHEDNANAIRNAPGASQPLNPELNRAGRRGLCQYAAYRDSSECVQHPDRANAPRTR